MPPSNAQPPPEGGQGPEERAREQQDHEPQLSTKSKADQPGLEPEQIAAGMALRKFTSALYGDLAEGFIEIRLIEDRKDGDVVGREWYSSFAALFDDLPRLMQIAETRVAAVFFGVLPRREKGKGKAEDVLHGLVAWADIDFKNFAGGEAEARRRLEEFPHRPSIIVRSAHGLHVYWIVREPTSPKELAALSKRLARHLGGDHAFDAARILRLPGTYNRKDPENPILVEIEAIEPERAYNVSELEDSLDMVEGPDPVAAGTAPPEQDEAGGIHIANSISPRVQALIVEKVRIRNLFNGEGKPEVGPDGRKLDHTSSGYDFSLVLALAKRGVRDPSELATALWHRPDDAARSKGVEYIARTVRRALELVTESRAPANSVEADFQVDRVRVFKSNPAIYEFTIEGQSVRLGSAALRSRGQFATAFMDAIHRIPILPAPDEWPAYVNGLLAKAERVEMPPEASDEPALREAIESLVEDLPTGEVVQDLDHGKVLELDDGRRAFKTASLLRTLHEDFPGLGRHRLCGTLRDMGFVKATVRVGEGTAQVWRREVGP